MDNYDYNALANDVVRRGINMFESFDDWTKGAFALSNLGEGGLTIFKAISSLSQKYNAAECERKFKNALSTGNRIGIATFIYMCRQNGIDTNRFYVKDTVAPIVQPMATRKPGYHPVATLVSIDKAYLTKSFDLKMASDFVRFLQTLVDNVDSVVNATKLYYLGINHDGHVIYWYVDKDNLIRYGKVMAYGADGHRNRAFHPLSIPKELSHKGLLPAEYTIKQTLFGEHLLRYSQNADKTIGVVESEKTAVICSMFLPSLLWMATGSICNVQTGRMEAVKNRHVILYPDTDPESLAFRKWKERAAELNSLGWNIQVSDYLEKMATSEQRIKKIDIADLLIENLQNHRKPFSDSSLASL